MECSALPIGAQSNGQPFSARLTGNASRPSSQCQQTSRFRGFCSSALHLLTFFCVVHPGPTDVLQLLIDPPRTRESPHLASIGLNLVPLFAKHPKLNDNSPTASTTLTELLHRLGPSSPASFVWIFLLQAVVTWSATCDGFVVIFSRHCSGLSSQKLCY